MLGVGRCCSPKYASARGHRISSSAAHARSCPRSVIPRTASTTTVLRMPRITMTMSNSMSVKPLSRSVLHRRDLFDARFNFQFTVPFRVASAPHWPPAVVFEAHGPRPAPVSALREVRPVAGSFALGLRHPPVPTQPLDCEVRDAPSLRRRSRPRHGTVQELESVRPRPMRSMYPWTCRSVVSRAASSGAKPWPSSRSSRAHTSNPISASPITNATSARIARNIRRPAPSPARREAVGTTGSARRTRAISASPGSSRPWIASSPSS